jgi:hypothetical protein
MITVLIQVLCIFIFLTVFFFTYAAKKEGEIVTNQVKFLIDNFIGESAALLPSHVKEVAAKKLNTIETDTPANREAIRKINESNDAIKSKTIKISLIFTMVVLAITILSLVLSKKTSLAFFKNIDMKNIGKETVIILIFVAITEFCFFTYLGADFVSVDPSIIKGRIFSNLANIFSSNP